MDERKPNELVEPDFSTEQDLIVMVKGEEAFSSPVYDNSVKANILLLSYNRPKMIQEAIASVLQQSFQNFDLYVVDDGSDFDVWETICSFVDDRILLFQAEKISVKQRKQESRLGRNLNSVLTTLRNEDVCFYLCDDDIMAPEFLARCMTGFHTYPTTHVVAGESWYFNDTEGIANAKYGMDIYEKSGIPTAYWSTGSFGHKVKCFRDEGLKWKDSTIGHSQDTNFLLDIWNLHQDYIYIPTPAIYRREHENTLSAKLGRKGEDGRYTPGFIPGPLTEEMIDGMME